MSVTTGSFGRSDSGTGGGSGAAAGGALLIIMSLASVMLLQGEDTQRVLLCSLIAMIIYTLMAYSPVAGIPVAFVYLASLGGVKRYLIPLLGYTSFDPLLLVIPVIVILHIVNRIVTRDIPADTRTSKLVGWLFFLMVLEVFNPLQGGLQVGLAGGLFYIVPLCWFYVGRSAATEPVVKALSYTVIGVALINAVHGYYQMYFGFTDPERQWMIISKNADIMHVGGHGQRVFGFATSPQEHSILLMLGAVAACALTLKSNRLFILAWIFFMLTTIMTSVRGTVIMGLGASAAMWAIQSGVRRVWLPRLMVAVALCAAGTIMGLTRAKQVVTDDTAKTMINHQLNGLTNQKGSTAGAHSFEIVSGILSGFKNPLGEGLGTTTIAGGKFAEATAGGSEFDISNVFESLGFIGGMIYVYLIIWTFLRALDQWRKRPTQAALFVIGILVAGVGGWLNGGLYSLSMLCWFLVGSIDRIDAAELRQKRAAADAAAAALVTVRPTRRRTLATAPPAR